MICTESKYIGGGDYFHPYDHYPEALVFQTSDSLDRMLGRKTYVPG